MLECRLVEKRGYMFKKGVRMRKSSDSKGEKELVLSARAKYSRVDGGIATR